MRNSSSIPDDHPIKQLFRTLTERGLDQAELRDQDLLFYLADLLVEFMFIENLYGMRDLEGRPLEYLVDMLQQAMESDMPDKKNYYKHIGDYSLFILGMFPESLSHGRRAISPSYYADTGRIGYKTAGELESHWWKTMVFRKLADKFEHCVVSLNWVREYTSDPFYQYMLRRFNIS
ncbi:MAG: hypothetical protein DMG10_11050 [Acidobacteria bacterium]|nr:MAG: hypothetical protein DMG10_11050 [Acidobacteriota bacterium]PYV33463.1 MAG: hypothetical protein DMG09_22335 [Acidobacteriota bacterium]